jgi:hypothetical protein
MITKSGWSHGTTQATVMVAVCPAAIFADKGCEHGSSCSLPPDPLLVSVEGERPETWYVPGGSGTEKVPEVPTWTATCRWPAAVKVTVPGIGRSPGCCPPGTIGPPSMTSLPAR